MKTFLRIIVLVCGLGLFQVSNAQCDTIASICNKHIGDGFISDGQAYRALLLNEEVAEFHVTFYGGSTYRIAACSGLSDGNLIFSVYDKDRNLLFSNAEFQNSSYWDFKITSTVDCIIEAHLNPDQLASGCAVLLIAFKQ